MKGLKKEAVRHRANPQAGYSEITESAYKKTNKGVGISLDQTLEKISRRLDGHPNLSAIDALFIELDNAIIIQYGNGRIPVEAEEKITKLRNRLINAKSLLKQTPKSVSASIVLAQRPTTNTLLERTERILKEDLFDGKITKEQYLKMLEKYSKKVVR